jgi:molybdenum ABC transporter molybdate-binding protein
LIRAENIGQTFALGASQNVDAAFVAMSQLKKLKGNPSYWLVESSSHAAINQKAVLLSQKKAHGGAKQFFDYLKSEDAQRRISAAGYHYQKAYLP